MDQLLRGKRLSVFSWDSIVVEVWTSYPFVCLPVSRSVKEWDWGSGPEALSFGFGSGTVFSDSLTVAPSVPRPEGTLWSYVDSQRV